MFSVTKISRCGLSSLFKSDGWHNRSVARNPATRVHSLLGPSLSGDEIVDLVSNGSDLVESPWQSGRFPRDSILWPNSDLEVIRSQPLHHDVRDRLVNMWSTSSSHGVSWDELDEAFVDFHREYVQKESEWSSNYQAVWDRQYTESERVLRSTLSGDESHINAIMHRRRGKIRRMTHTRMGRLRFKEVVKPFHIRQFTAYMRDFVTQRIIKREETERANIPS